MDTTSTRSPVDRELDVLKAKRGEPASAEDVDHLDEVEALKAKLAGNSAAAEHEKTRLDVLKTKSVRRRASSASSLVHEELEILKAKRGAPGARGAERADDLDPLKAKIAGNPAETEGEATSRNTVRKTRLVERSTPTTNLPRGGFGVASVSARSAPVGSSDGAPLRRRSAFDLAFALVLALWALAVALALTTRAEWWFFGFCVVVTVAVALLGLLDSGFRQKPPPN